MADNPLNPTKWQSLKGKAASVGKDALNSAAKGIKDTNRDIMKESFPMFFSKDNGRSSAPDMKDTTSQKREKYDPENTNKAIMARGFGELNFSIQKVDKTLQSTNDYLWSMLDKQSTTNSLLGKINSSIQSIQSMGNGDNQTPSGGSDIPSVAKKTAQARDAKGRFQSSSSTAPAAGNMSRFIKWGGRALGPLSAGLAGASEYMDSGNAGRAASVAGGAFAGGWGGAAAGALAGSAIGPWGTIAGGFIGSIGGGALGSSLGRAGYDSITRKDNDISSGLPSLSRLFGGESVGDIASGVPVQNDTNTISIDTRELNITADKIILNDKSLQDWLSGGSASGAAGSRAQGGSGPQIQGGSAPNISSGIPSISNLFNKSQNRNDISSGLPSFGNPSGDMFGAGGDASGGSAGSGGDASGGSGGSSRPGRGRRDGGSGPIDPQAVNDAARVASGDVTSGAKFDPSKGTYGGVSSFDKGAVTSDSSRLIPSKNMPTGRAGLHKNSKLENAESNHTMSALGIDSRQFNAYRQALVDIESRGGEYGITGGSSGRFSGAYQMGQAEIEKTAKQLGEKVPSREAFLKDKKMQERYFDRYTKDHHDYLMANSPQYAKMSPEKKLEVLGYAHNQGEGGATKWLNSGIEGRDAFGTRGTKYSDAIRRQLDATKNDKDAPPNPNKFEGANVTGIDKKNNNASNDKLAPDLFNPNATKMPAGTPEASRVDQKQGEVAATRKGELNPELVDQMNYAAHQAGVKVEVHSGGQRMEGAPGFVGGHRHDDGNAADHKLYREINGKKVYLDMRNPEDAAIMGKYVENHAKAGGTGFGAGLGYMGPNMIHSGGGKPAVWAGSGESPPLWLQDSYARGMKAQKDFGAKGLAAWKAEQQAKKIETARVRIATEEEEKAAKRDIFGSQANPFTKGKSIVPEAPVAEKADSSMAKGMKLQRDSEEAAIEEKAKPKAVPTSSNEKPESSSKKNVKEAGDPSGVKAKEPSAAAPSRENIKELFTDFA